MTSQTHAIPVVTTTIPAQLPPDHVALAHAWNERCRRGAFSSAVQGLGTIRVFGSAGDAPVVFPRIESLAALETLEPDEQWAAQYATTVVRAHQAVGRPIFAALPGQGASGAQIDVFDVTLKADVLVLSPITGG